MGLSAIKMCAKYVQYLIESFVLTLNETKSDAHFLDKWHGIGFYFGIAGILLCGKFFLVPGAFVLLFAIFIFN